MFTSTLLRYCDLENNEIELRRLAGLKRKEFELLHRFFDNYITDYFTHFTLEGTPRNRRASIRKNSIFVDSRDALLFILIYLNGKILQDQLAVIFEVDQPKISKYVKFYRHILYQVIESHPRAISRYKKERIFKNIYK